jgi:hypothetical protein
LFFQSADQLSRKTELLRNAFANGVGIAEGEVCVVLHE